MSEGSHTAPPLSAAQQALERRIDWLIEDLAVVKRRATATFATASNGSYGSQNRHGFSGMKERAAQILAEIGEDREWHVNLESSIDNIETTLVQERGNREKALGTLTTELEETMQSLVKSIDGGLNESTKELASRAAKTEGALKALILRLEEGLVSGSRELQNMASGRVTPGQISAGMNFEGFDVMSMLAQTKSGSRPGSNTAAALNQSPQDLARSFMASLPKLAGSTSTTPGAFPPMTMQLQDVRAGSLQVGNGSLDNSLRSVPEQGKRALDSGNLDKSLGASTSMRSILPQQALVKSSSKTGSQWADAKAPGQEVAAPLLQVWSELQEENMRLREKRMQLEARQQRSRINSTSGSVAASRNRSPNGQNSNLGSGFRCRSPAANAGCVDVLTTKDQGAQAVKAMLQSLAQEHGKTASVKDSDAVSTTSSLRTSASTQNKGIGSQDGPYASRTVDQANSYGSMLISQGSAAPKHPGLRSPVSMAPSPRQKSPVRPAGAAPGQRTGVPYVSSVHAQPGVSSSQLLRPSPGAGRAPPGPGRGGGYPETSPLMQATSPLMQARVPRPVQIGQRSTVGSASNTVSPSPPGSLPVTAAIRPSMGRARAHI